MTLFKVVSASVVFKQEASALKCATALRLALDRFNAVYAQCPVCQFTRDALQEIQRSVSATYLNRLTAI